MIYRVAIAINMLVCALIPGARPRETLSGLMGRWSHEGRLVGRLGERLINAVHPEPEHCQVTYQAEEQARNAA